MNKKFLIIGLISLFAVGLVSALAYYGVFSQTFNVVSAVGITECIETIDGDVFSGGLTEGNVCIISNVAPTERTITLNANTSCDVETSYATTLELNKKETTNWTIIPETTISLSYTFIGNNFWYKVNGVPENHVVVYYPDVNGNPGDWNINNASLVGDANTEWTQSNVGYLPKEYDWNNKAKLWVIPRADWESKAWNPSEWYFENNLITYGETITLDGESSISVIPLYDIAVGVDGTCIVETTVA